ncbi:MAG: hypothetical protein PHG29_03375, partial [Prolixibacteraceae bacterium]|nr:hypothetical protein [Prolixibacteraceae bacterium]
MKRKLLYIFLTFIFCITALTSYSQQQRFPKPEFSSGYEQPDVVTPEPRSGGFEYLDVAVLLVVLSLAAWFALRKRSRQGILWLSVFTLVYFGFYRNGCICSVG